jgi:hypothetical protein
MDIATLKKIMMETTFFYEEQSFRKKWIFFLAFFLCLILFGIMLYGLVSQVFYNIPFGSHPTSNTGMWWLAAFATIITVGIPMLIYQSKLTTKVKDDGFYFRYFPFQLNFKKIDLASIEKYKIKEFSPFSDYGGWGIRKKMFKKETAYIVKGNKGIEFTYKDGKIVLIGTQKPDEIKAAVSKLF